MITSIFFLTSLVVNVIMIMIVSVTSNDMESLLKFRESLENNNALLSSWNESTPPCSGDSSNWPGIECYKGHVWGLHLDNMRLKGAIDIQSLRELPFLRTISLNNNDFDTEWPDILQIEGLKNFFISNNKFYGEIPAQAFQGMQWLKKIHLSNNHFTGLIPTSLASMPRLLELRLEGNQFTGSIPNFQHGLKSFSVANNQVEGEIPSSLHKMPASSFSGNEGLCGAPLGNACSSKMKKKSILSIVVVVVLVILALIVIGAVILLVVRGRRKQGDENSTISRSRSRSESQKKETDEGSTRSRRSSSRSSRSSLRLSFVRDDREQFDLQELLRASAEILGSGCYSSSYKAGLLNGPEMVVKRFKQMNNVGREEFQDHMQRIGRLNHPNLLPLVAYYYRKEEKLLVTDFVKNGSLAVWLHAEGQQSLDWGSRLKIVKGITKGVEYLHREMPNIIAAHGQLKSSNVLLSDSLEPILTDYALVPVINQELAPDIMFIYKSPEYLQHGRITKKTDVWTLGILILEILTGNLPASFLPGGGGGGGSDMSFAQWVHSAEEYNNEVFDKDMDHTQNNQGEMLKLLNIALACCEVDVDKRWDLKQAVERIQEVNEETDQDHHSHAPQFTFSIEEEQQQPHA